MRYLFLLFLCGALQASAQTSVPVLVHSGVDTLSPMTIELNKNGYAIGFTYYQYCTNVICFNDGMRVTVYDSNAHLATDIRLEKPNNNTSTSSKVQIQEAAVDNNNDLILVGNFHSDVEFNPNDLGHSKLVTGNTEFSNTADAFIAKYHVSDGKLVWVKVLSGSGNPMSSFAHLTLDPNNNIYLVLSKLYGTYDIDPGSGTASVTGACIAKYNSNGDYITHKMMGAISTQYYKCLRYTDKGLFLLTHEDSAGKKTFAMKQYDVNTLNTIKSKRFGLLDEDITSTGRRKTIDFAFGRNHEIWMIGDHISTLNLPATNAGLNESLAYNDRGFFLAKLDTAWNVTDVKLLQVTSSPYYCPVKLAVDNMNGLMIIGSVADSLDADLGTGVHWVKPAGNKPNGYMMYYDNNLALQWAKTFGNTAYTNVATAQVYNGNVFVSGTMQGTTDFCLTGSSGTMLTNMLNVANGYWAHYRWNTAIPNAIRETFASGTGLTLYPNPAMQTLFVQSAQQHGNVTYRIYDTKGSMLMEYNTAETNVQLPVNNLAAGVYYLQADNGKDLHESHRFLKQ